MQVFFKTLTGRTITLDLQPNDSTGAIARRLQQAMDLPDPDMVRMIAAGGELGNSEHETIEQAVSRLSHGRESVQSTDIIVVQRLGVENNRIARNAEELERGLANGTLVQIWTVDDVQDESPFAKEKFQLYITQNFDEALAGYRALIENLGDRIEPRVDAITGRLKTPRKPFITCCVMRADEFRQLNDEAGPDEKRKYGTIKSHMRPGGEGVLPINRLPLFTATTLRLGGTEAQNDFNVLPNIRFRDSERYRSQRRIFNERTLNFAGPEVDTAGPAPVAGPGEATIDLTKYVGVRNLIRSEIFMEAEGLGGEELKEIITQLNEVKTTMETPVDGREISSVPAAMRGQFTGTILGLYITAPYGGESDRDHKQATLQILKQEINRMQALTTSKDQFYTEEEEAVAGPSSAIEAATTEEPKGKQEAEAEPAPAAEVATSATETLQTETEPKFHQLPPAFQRYYTELNGDLAEMMWNDMSSADDHSKMLAEFNTRQNKGKMPADEAGPAVEDVAGRAPDTGTERRLASIADFLCLRATPEELRVAPEFLYEGFKNELLLLAEYLSHQLPSKRIKGVDLANIHFFDDAIKNIRHAQRLLGEKAHQVENYEGLHQVLKNLLKSKEAPGVLCFDQGNCLELGFDMDENYQFAQVKPEFAATLKALQERGWIFVNASNDNAGRLYSDHLRTIGVQFDVDASGASAHVYRIWALKAMLEQEGVPATEVANLIRESREYNLTENLINDGSRTTQGERTFEQVSNQVKRYFKTKYPTVSDRQLELMTALFFSVSVCLTGHYKIITATMDNLAQYGELRLARIREELDDFGLPNTDVLNNTAKQIAKEVANKAPRVEAPAEPQESTRVEAASPTPENPFAAYEKDGMAGSIEYLFTDPQLKEIVSRSNMTPEAFFSSLNEDTKHRLSEIAVVGGLSEEMLGTLRQHANGNIPTFAPPAYTETPDVAGPSRPAIPGPIRKKAAKTAEPTPISGEEQTPEPAPISEGEKFKDYKDLDDRLKAYMDEKHTTPKRSGKAAWALASERDRVKYINAANSASKGIFDKVTSFFKPKPVEKPAEKVSLDSMEYGQLPDAFKDFLKEQYNEADDLLQAKWTSSARMRRDTVELYQAIYPQAKP